MTLATFHTLVSNTINRGTTQDTALVDYVRLAAKWLEQNYTFAYMEDYSTGSTLTTSTRTLSVPARIKSVQMFRLVNDDNEYDNLEYADLSQNDSTESGQPRSYDFDGKSTFVFDKTPDEDYPYELKSVQFTDWPTNTSLTPTLLTEGEVALLSQTMILMAPLIRLEPKYYQMYQRNRDEAIRVMFLADDEFRRANRKEFIRYGLDR